MTQFVCSVALQDGTRVHDAVQADNAASARFILHYRYKDRYKSSDIVSETVMPQAYECPVCHNTEHRPGALICKVCGEPLPAWLREQRPSMDMVNASSSPTTRPKRCGRPWGTLGTRSATGSGCPKGLAPSPSAS